MTKRLLVLVVFLSLLLPNLSHAQDSELLFDDLTGVYTVTDLGFTFGYPQSWVGDTSNGITLAENEADLAAEVDNDPATTAAGYTITLRALPLTALELPPNTLLEQVAPMVIELAGLTLNNQFDYPFLARHTVFVEGVDSQGDPGVANIWIQDGFLVIFGMGAPQEVGVTSDTYFTWGFILGTATAITEPAVELTEEFSALEFGGFTISHPAGWAAGTDPAGGSYIFEVASDVEAVVAGDPPTGRGLIWTPATFEEFGLTTDSLPADLHTLITTNNAEAVINEYMLFDTVGFGFSDSPNTYLMVGLLEDEVYLVYLLAPSPEDLQAFIPLALNILKSIKTAE